MSVAKLQRRLERERVSNRTLAKAQALAAAARPRWTDEGRRQGVLEERERRTLLLGLNEDEMLLGAYPEQETVRVWLPSAQQYGAAMSLEEAMNSERMRRVMPLHAQFVTFRAVKKAWRSGTGKTVVWYDWEGPRP